MTTTKRTPASEKSYRNQSAIGREFAAQRTDAVRHLGALLDAVNRGDKSATAESIHAANMALSEMSSLRGLSERAARKTSIK